MNTAVFPKTLADALGSIGQSHLVEHASTLEGSTLGCFIEQLDALDLPALGRYIQTYGKGYTSPPTSDSIKPASCYTLCDESWDREHYRKVGQELIGAGKVACFTVAGGQGSRLGYDGPKGCFPTSCVNEKPLFQLFAEAIVKSQQKYGCTIPWAIMTSPLNHEATVAFFGANNFFGLTEKQVMFFEQGVMPSFDLESGRLLLAGPGILATNPDGHGGAYRALKTSGALDAMLALGIEQLSYFQVDNPHAKILDPVFLGLHSSGTDSSGEMSSKMVAKASWDEKVGVFCSIDGKSEIIEYSDLPEHLAKQTDDAGALAFNAGSIAIHAISLAFIEKIVSDPRYALAFHRAVKKVAWVDPLTAQVITPTEPNAIKLERFVFDGIKLAEASIVLETERVEEFAPVKNATGADSIESSKVLQTERAARWLESIGVAVPRNGDGSVDAVIEISPLSAVEPNDLRSLDLATAIEPGSSVVL
ncbi:MAG: UDPGP type 1 family protein [Phycisphaerales bacterium]|nr:UDPGP type 1 family protein [Phycisphaerales bacterium]